jgi:hypothetical protein
MSNFAETTRQQFVDQATKAYMRGDYEAAAWFEKQVERHTVKPGTVKPERTRCPHYKAIRRFFAIAREAGLDTSAAAKPRMRHALESAMGRYVDSRGEVTANEWMMLGDRVKAGLSW